ncbi:TPA: serine/threonine protein kinase [Klebsiella pneumoniae]
MWKLAVSRPHFIHFQHSCLPWHYPNSPKNRETPLSPRRDWLLRGSMLKKDPLRIWFYPQ